MQTIKINEISQGSRLDKFLVETLADFSRSKIQKLIKSGLVLINDKPATVHQFLKENDIVTISDNTTADENKTEEKAQTILTKNKTAMAEVKIVAEEKDFFIIEKPAGMLVHPTEKEEKDTLVDWILSKHPELKKIGENPQRPAIVHRLDKDVSGLMIIPKTQESFEYFKRQFKLHLITKKYWALVYGSIIRDEDEINLMIGRSRTKKGLFAARPESQENENSKKALTKFSVVERFINHTLLELDILTGRTHQIRVHMFSYGHPIVGDTLYFLKRGKKIDIGRIFLHAHLLSFVGPDGKNKEFSSPLPESLKSILTGIKK